MDNLFDKLHKSSIMTRIYQFIIKHFTQIDVIAAQPAVAETESDNTLDNFILGMTNQHLKKTNSTLFEEKILKNTTSQV